MQSAVLLCPRLALSSVELRGHNRPVQHVAALLGDHLAGFPRVTPTVVRPRPGHTIVPPRCATDNSRGHYWAYTPGPCCSGPIVVLRIGNTVKNTGAPHGLLGISVDHGVLGSNPHYVCIVRRSTQRCSRQPCRSGWPSGTLERSVTLFPRPTALTRCQVRQTDFDLPGATPPPVKPPSYCSSSDL